jgi:hypothetical protein
MKWNQGTVQWTDTHMDERKGWTLQTEYQLDRNCEKCTCWQCSLEMKLPWAIKGVSMVCISNISHTKIVLFDFIHCLNFKWQCSENWILLSSLGEKWREDRKPVRHPGWASLRPEKPHVRSADNNGIILGFSVLLLPRSDAGSSREPKW